MFFKEDFIYPCIIFNIFFFKFQHHYIFAPQETFLIIINVKKSCAA